MRGWTHWISGIALALLALPALAQSPLPATDQPTFNAIGRINIAGYKSRSMCSGTLISSDQVLTAAHCLKLQNGAWAPPHDIHFLAGYRQGSFVAHRMGAKILEAAEASSESSGPLKHIAEDFAILELAAPISSSSILPFRIDHEDLNQSGDKYTLISYRRDRPHIVSRQDDCRAVRTIGDVIGVSCRVVSGSSGGPLLSIDETGVRIKAILSASRLSPGAVGAYAVVPKFNSAIAPDPSTP